LIAGAIVASLLVGIVLVAGPAPEPIAGATASPSATPVASDTPEPGETAAPIASPTARATIATTGFHIGELAPALRVPQVGGGTIDLEALRGKAVWVNFMATWCPSCQDEFPIMNGFAARYADDGLVVIAIDVREEEGNVAAFGRSLSVIFPMGLDADGSTMQGWDVIALPTHFWLDAEGVIRDGAFGGIGPDIMAEALRKILPGVEITT
jgi:thiol-disulfide isomerase/thioredoxin